MPPTTAPETPRIPLVAHEGTWRTLKVCTVRGSPSGLDLQLLGF